MKPSINLLLINESLTAISKSNTIYYFSVKNIIFYFMYQLNTDYLIQLG